MNFLPFLPHFLGAPKKRAAAFKSAVPLAADLRNGVIDFVRARETADNAIRDDVVCWVLCSPDGNYVAGVHGSCLSGPVSHIA